MTSAKKQLVRIGNASGYWGDDPDALRRQVEGGRLDYITMDFLAEVTMSIMQKQKGRDPAAGYAKDFIAFLEPVLKKLLQDKTRIITNAGGVNPEACAEAIAQLGKKLGVSPRIAVVYGDDILADLDLLNAKGASFDNMETGEKFSAVRGRIEAANVYYGAAPVAEALRFEPDIVITGRVTDTGITIGAMMHELGWQLTDFDKLAAGTVAGHILECGAQATGGNFSDWHRVPSFHNIGYPICEMEASGDFVITKHPHSGGLITVDTVREQLFYEMGDPGCYITPDGVADFTTIKLSQDGPNRVRISGVRGGEPTPLYKVSMAYRDGYKVIGDIAISGPKAMAKAEAFSELFWSRVGKDFQATSTEFFGFNALQRSAGLARPDDAQEIMLRLGARDQNKDKLRALAKQIPALILSGPPGVCILGGVPKVHDIVSYWPALMPKHLSQPKISLWQGRYTETRSVDTTLSGNFEKAPGLTDIATKVEAHPLGVFAASPKAVPLQRLALGRSGDKGDTANIGIMARGPKSYQFLERHLTAQVVKNIFHDLCHGRVIRHAVPNMLGFNFLLEGTLDGGGTMSLRSDAQGKTLAQALLRQPVQIPDELLGELAGQGTAL